MNNEFLNLITIFILLNLFITLNYIKASSTLYILIGIILILFCFNLITNTHYFKNESFVNKNTINNLQETQDKKIENMIELLKKFDTEKSDNKYKEIKVESSKIDPEVFNDKISYYDYHKISSKICPIDIPSTFNIF